MGCCALLPNTMITMYGASFLRCFFPQIREFHIPYVDVMDADDQDAGRSAVAIDEIWRAINHMPQLHTLSFEGWYLSSDPILYVENFIPLIELASSTPCQQCTTIDAALPFLRQLIIRNGEHLQVPELAERLSSAFGRAIQVRTC